MKKWKKKPKFHVTRYKNKTGFKVLMVVRSKVSMVVGLGTNLKKWNQVKIPKLGHNS